MDTQNHMAQKSCPPLHGDDNHRAFEATLGDNIGRLAQYFPADELPRAGNAERLRAELEKLLEGITSMPTFVAGFDKYRHQARKKCHPWCWEILYLDSLVAAGLLCIDQDSPIPLHDHPGSIGIQMLLYGQLYLEQFDKQGAGCKSKRTASLRRSHTRHLTLGDISCFSPREGNVHRLRSESPRSIQLCLLIHPYEESARAWYFPLATDGTGMDCFHASLVHHRSFHGY